MEHAGILSQIPFIGIICCWYEFVCYNSKSISISEDLKDGRLFEELALIRELGAYSRGAGIRYYCVEGGHLFEGDA